MIERIGTFFNGQTNPYRNLAMEEYLTRTVEKGTCILYLWQNQNTVVIGRNQNAWKECRTGALEESGGFLARRLSGGGAVYHDLGNLNFTFSVCQEDYDLRKQQRVILEACRLLGIQAELSGRNDLLANGGKFSGNSFYSHDGKAFHNGTLLLDVDLSHMECYLSPSKAKIVSKGVDSVRARVVNLKSLCPELTTEMMCQAMNQAFEQVYGLTAEVLDEADFDQAALEAGYERFSSYDWKYGQSMPFDFSATEKFPWGEITLQWCVQEGKCRQAVVYTDALNPDFAQPLAQQLEGCPFTQQALCDAIGAVDACKADGVAQDLCALIREKSI